MPLPNKGGLPPKRGWGKDIGWASSVGLTLVFSTAIGLALGLGFDRWFRTKPLFTLLFLILGIAAGFWNIFKGIRK